MEQLDRRLADGEVILIDGGTGTELERRGVSMDGAAWTAAAVATDPDVVRQVHEDYIRAGAEIIITNTFSTAKHQLEPAGLGDQFHEINANAAILASQARDNVAGGRIYVAGSISSVHFSPDYIVPVETAAQNFREQADILAGEGVDFLIMEMMWDVDYSSAAISAALATGLPVWIGFTTRVGDDGRVLMIQERSDEPLAEALDAILPLGGSVMTVMHTETQDVAAALAVVHERFQGPIGAYGHSGEFVMPNWQFNDIISPEDYLAAAQQWVQMGTQIIGGCCGIGPEHVRLLKEGLPAHVSAA